MPEGPEAKIIADRLNLTLAGTRIDEIHLEKTAKHTDLDKVTPGLEIINVTAYGKRVRIQLEDGSEIVTALGMEGKWIFEENFDLKNSVGKFLFNRNHSHIKITCGETKIWFNDTRRFGWVELVARDKVSAYYKRFGPDLLQENVQPEEWLRIFQQRRWKNRQIGNALLDQEFVAGIGNYLRADILFEAKLSPFRKISHLTQDELERLRVSALSIIRKAYETGGYSLGSYRDPDGKTGNYESLVYGKTVVDGYKVERGETSDKRTIWWVPEVQK